MFDRKFTLDESMRLVFLAADIRKTVDVELGDIIAKLAAGDDSVLPACHDRLNVIGRHELADRLRWIIG